MAQSAGNTIELNPTQPDVKRSFQNSIQGDKGIWTIVLLLSLISLAVVYSSSSSLAYRESTTAFFFLLKQSGFVLIGFAVLYVCHRIPLGWYRKLAVIGLIASIFLLIITPFIGVTLNNGTRWLKVLGFSFQPAEVAKIALMLYIAKVVESSELKTFKEFAIYLLLPISAVCLLILWGSVSAGIMLGGIAFIVLVVAGVSGPYLVKTVGIIAVVAVLVFAIAKWTHLFPRIETAVSRFTTYVHDDKGDHFQATQAKIAIASGGFFGKGPGNSTQRYILPHPYSDFIYATIVEEYGVVGGATVMLLFIWLFYRTYRIAKQCTRVFSSLLAVGLGVLIVLQAILHMCVNVGLLPVTGQTLPLVSLGGTSFVIMSAAFGMILAVSRTVDKKQTEETTEVVTS